MPHVVKLTDEMPLQDVDSCGWNIPFHIIKTFLEIQDHMGFFPLGIICVN